MRATQDFGRILLATALFAALAAPGLIPQQLTGAALEMVGSGPKCAGVHEEGACPDDENNDDVDCTKKKDVCYGTSEGKHCSRSSTKTACIAIGCRIDYYDVCE